MERIARLPHRRQTAALPGRVTRPSSDTINSQTVGHSTQRNCRTTLGEWHDRSVLLHHVAEFIGRPDFLADHPDIGRILLTEMEKER